MWDFFIICKKKLKRGDLKKIMLLGGREDKKKANNASSRLKASRDSMSYIQWPQILTQILGWGEKICKR